MARGDFSKAFAYYRANGGALGRKEFAQSDAYKLCLVKVREAAPVVEKPMDWTEAT